MTTSVDLDLAKQITSAGVGHPRSRDSFLGFKASVGEVAGAVLAHFTKISPAIMKTTHGVLPDRKIIDATISFLADHDFASESVSPYSKTLLKEAVEAINLSDDRLKMMFMGPNKLVRNGSSIHYGFSCGRPLFFLSAHKPGVMKGLARSDMAVAHHMAWEALGRKLHMSRKVIGLEVLKNDRILFKTDQGSYEAFIKNMAHMPDWAFDKVLNELAAEYKGRKDHAAVIDRCSRAVAVAAQSIFGDQILPGKPQIRFIENPGDAEPYHFRFVVRAMFLNQALNHEEFDIEASAYLRNDQPPKHNSSSPAVEVDGISISFEHLKYKISDQEKLRQKLAKGILIRPTLQRALSTLGEAASKSLIEALITAKSYYGLSLDQRKIMRKAGIEEIYIVDGEIKAKLRLGKNVTWANGRVTLTKTVFPESVLSQIDGSNIEDIVGHPLLKESRILRYQSSSKDIALFLDEDLIPIEI